jgi:hypothetical protein
VFAAAAAVAFIVSDSSRADAKEVNHATSCMHETDYAGDYVVNSTGVANQSSGLGWRPRNLYCPLSSNVRESLTGGILLDVYDGDHNNGSYARVLASVCLKSYSGTAITCSANTEITFNTETGSFSRGLDSEDLTLLRDATKLYWYATMFVQLPAYNLAPGKLYGYTAF